MNLEAVLEGLLFVVGDDGLTMQQIKDIMSLNDDEAKENLEKSLEDESYSIISDKNNSEIKLKFKLIEFFAENGLFTADSNM